MISPEQVEVFRRFDHVSAAPLVACFRAAAAGYRDLDIETLMVLAWTCFRWERDGKIPRPEESPTIVFPGGPSASEAK